MQSSELGYGKKTACFGIYLSVAAAALVLLVRALALVVTAGHTEWRFVLPVIDGMSLVLGITGASAEFLYMQNIAFHRDIREALTFMKDDEGTEVMLLKIELLCSSVVCLRVAYLGWERMRDFYMAGNSNVSGLAIAWLVNGAVLKMIYEKYKKEYLSIVEKESSEENTGESYDT